MYFYWQATPRSSWTCALASERERVTRDKQPAFVTVLDVDNPFDRDLTLEELRSVKYAGPLYFDFDGETIEDVIPAFQTVLNKFREMNLDLDSVRVYATGGRGFHIEVPMGAFMPKVPPTGVAGLPHVYREIAHALYVDLMDLRVYSTKQGRMWRCPGVERDNNLYKVPITAHEALSITPERYQSICSSPRAPIPIQPPTFNPELGLLYARAKDKVDTGLKAAKKRKAKVNELKKFKGQWPSTVKAILNGDTLKEGVGWNRIAMQLAMTADALGKKEAELLEDAEPLLETYSGDSARYGNYRKRKAHLQEMYRYLAGNITYDWSAGGLIALVAKGTDVSDISNGEYEPDEEPEQGSEEKPEGEDEDEDEDDSIAGSIRVAKSGLYVRDKESGGWVRACHVGLANFTRLLDLKHGTAIGYEVEVFVEGRSEGMQELPLRALSNKAQMQNWTMQWSASVSGTDKDISSLADLLRRKTDRSKNVMYTLNREGVDLINRRDSPDYDVVFASADGVLSSQGLKYRFRSDFDSNHAGYTDLLRAPHMTDTPENRELIENLLSINTPLNLGLGLGWLSACFLCQPIRRASRQFPTLQVFGQAGAGKSATLELLSNLHYYRQTPRKLAAAGQTLYPIIAAVVGSASTPVIFEEVKRREMSKTQIDALMNLLRNAYDGSQYQRGGLGAEGKGPVIHDYTVTAPTVILGESLENQSAVLERCVVMSLSKAHRLGREDAFSYVEGRRADLGMLGRVMVDAALALDLGGLALTINTAKSEIRQAMGAMASSGRDRPVHNHAVILVGLRFLGQVLNLVFGDTYAERIQVMIETILANINTIIPDNKSEASRVLDTLAQLTREDDPRCRLERGRDYTMDDVTIDLKLKLVYPRYVRWMRGLGQEPLYDNIDAFIAGMNNYAGVVDRVCMDNPVLKTTPVDVVYRFSIDQLTKEGVENFKH